MRQVETLIKDIDVLNSIQSPLVREIGRPGRRVLGLSEFGDPDGFPVLAFHGIPGSRLMFRPANSIARQHGLRFIAPDRPGFGASTVQVGRTLADWIGDVEAILTACRVDQFALLGVSGGGPFAVASAAHFGERVSALTLIGPVGPIAELDCNLALNRLHRALFLRLPRAPVALRAVSESASACFRLAPSVQYNIFLRLLPDVDRAIVSDAHLKALIIEDVRESLRQYGQGMRADLTIFSQPWQIDYSKITSPSVIWQGLEDTIVPTAAAFKLGKLIPHCVVEEIPGAGHFWIYENIERVLLRLRKQINARSTVEKHPDQGVS